MLDILEQWQALGWVDSYLVHDEFSKRPKTIWRATSLLQTEWKEKL